MSGEKAQLLTVLGAHCPDADAAVRGVRVQPRGWCSFRNMDDEHQPTDSRYHQPGDGHCLYELFSWWLENVGLVMLGSVRKPCPVLQNNQVSASTAESFAQPELVGA